MSIFFPSFYYFAFAFVALVLLTILFKKEKSVPKSLRICSLFLLLSCLFEPIFRFIFVSKPWVLVLVDTSKSMGVGGRLEKVKQILPEIHSFCHSERSEESLYGFDTHPYPISRERVRTFPTITSEDKLTSIGNALLETPTPSIYLLLSDGVNNFGPDPISIAQQKNIPIYTVKLEDSLAGDVRISGLVYNKVVYPKDKIPIKVRFENLGYNEQEVQILLKEGNRILQKKSILLTQDMSQNEIEFSVTPKETGMHLYEVNIPGLPGEINEENNKREFGIMVLKSRVKIGWFSQTPSWNFKFAKLELSHAPNVEFDWWIKVKEGGWLSKNGITSVPDFYAPYDVVILENFDYPGAEKLIHKETGVIIIGEANISPFILGSSIRESKYPIEVMEDFDIFGSKELPPLREIYSVKGVKGGAKIICNTREDNPLIVRSGAIIGIAANDVWRWSFLPGLKFWTKMLSLITMKEPVLFVETEPVIEVGERVIFKLEAYTQTYTPDTNCDIVVKVVPSPSVILSDSEESRSVSSIKIPLYSLGDGKYEGVIEFLPPGKYKYEAISYQGSRVFKGVPPSAGLPLTGEFIVVSQLEFQKLSSDPNFLRTLSSVSGGEYLEDIKELKNVSAKLTLPKKSKLPLNLSYSYLSLLLIILLLSVEWFWLRK